MVAKKAAGVVGSGVGSAAGGFFNNPGVVAAIAIIAAIGIPLLIFRKDITNFLNQGVESLVNIDIPNPFEGFEFPNPFEDFEFPNPFEDFEFPNPFEGFEFPSNPFEDFEFPTLPNFDNFFSGFQEQFDTFLENFQVPGGNGEGGDFTSEGQAGARSDRGNGMDQAIDTQLPSQDPSLNVPTGTGGVFGGLLDFLGLTPAQAFAQQSQGPTLENLNVQTALDTGQQFFGGGPSFQGGFVTETPVEFLSLSQIIDMGLATTASEAANLKAIAQGFTPEEEAFLNQGPVDVGGFVSGGPPAVSDPQFQGLTPEQIALMLTGGNISNF